MQIILQVENSVRLRILNDPQADTKVNVLNGIAWDQAGKRIFVAGKNWPSLFEIRITE